MATVGDVLDNSRQALATSKDSLDYEAVMTRVKREAEEMVLPVSDTELARLEQMLDASPDWDQTDYEIARRLLAEVRRLRAC